MKYKIKTTNEDIKEAVIEKSGIKTEFKINDLLEQIQILKNQRVNVERECTIHEARINRIEEANPELAELAEVMDYDKVKGFVDYFSSKLAIIDSQEAFNLIDKEVERYKNEISAIEKCLEVSIPVE